ncbi:MAG TPA: hypothetical protein VGG89_05585 [Candidatus Baltobacteraceae bacterium]
MKTKVQLVAASLVLACTAPALAAVVDSNMIPDGQYVVKVERVQDAHHVLVLMSNGVETVLVARGDVDFSKLKPNDSVRVALVKGVVPVFEPLQ